MFSVYFFYSGPYCVAIETFVAEGPDDLSFEIGDVIEITERIDENWLRGTTHGQFGMFPQVFVDVKVDTPVGLVSGKDDKDGGDEDSNMATAVSDFDGQEGDLTFKVQ